jgi:hypothetical protein
MLEFAGEVLDKASRAITVSGQIAEHDALMSRWAVLHGMLSFSSRVFVGFSIKFEPT